MQIVFLAELNAYDPFNDKLVKLHICEGGHGPVVYDDKTYVPCLAKRNTYQLTLSDSGESSEPSISYDSIGVRIHSDFDNLEWHDYDFDGYPCTIMWGEYGAPLATFKPWPSGRTGQSVSVKPTVLEIDISGPDSELQKEILTTEFAGTGAAEGAEDHKGVLKPFAIGGVENISADPVDTVYLVYQYHGYGPTEGVKAVYENALTLGDPIRRVNSYEELIGLTAEQLPPGSWAHAPAVGMYRLGTEPTGKHTADVGGALDENGEPLRTIGKIAPWMLHHIAGVPKAQINYASFDKLDRDFPHTWGNYINSQDKPENEGDIAISVGDFLRDAANQLGAYIMPDENGVFFAGRVTSDKEPTTLHQFGVAGPVIINDSISKEYPGKRAYKVRVGGRRCFEVHTDNEISSALKDAIEEVAVGVGKAVSDISDDVNELRGNFRDLAREALQADLIELQDINLEYGAGLLKANAALHNQNHIAIQHIGIRIDENGALVAEEITKLTSRVQAGEETVEAGFLEINRTIASEVEAVVEQFEAGIAKFGEDVEAAFVEERRIRAAADRAELEARETLEGRVGSTEGKIEEVERLVLEPNGATLEMIEEMGVKITDDYGRAIEAASRDTFEAIVGPEGAATKEFSGVNVRFGAVEGKLQELEEILADDDGATVRRVESLEARLSPTNAASYEQNIELIATTDGLVRSALTFKVANEIGGLKVIGGIGLVAENGVINTAFTTDTLAVYTPNGKQQLFYLDGEGAVLNSLIANKIEVKQAQIGDLLVDTIHVAGNAITANTFHTAGDRYCPAGGTVDFLSTGFVTIGDGYDGSAIVNIKFTIDATAYYDASCFVELFLDTNDGRGWLSVDSAVIGISTNSGNSYWRVAGSLIGCVDGSQVRVLARINSGQHTPNSVSRSVYVRNISMTIMGAKR